MDGEVSVKGKGKDNDGRESGEHPVLVVLVGAPGSGKSTFCESVMRAAVNRPWVRICQDSIANGKAGTKLQCLKNAAEALKEGKSVFVDRCNIDREQRAEFLKLGVLHVDVHAVVLDLPAQICVSRSVKRSEHEGNLQGGKAAAVVNRMLQKKELPRLSEGFSRITFCQNESDVQDAINTYSNLGLSNSLPTGCFGQRNIDSKIQLGIKKFMKKLDPPGNMPSDGNSSKDITTKGTAVHSVPRGKRDANENYNDGKFTGSREPKDSVTWNRIPTLAFPSISTSDFQFDHDKASNIIIERVRDFLEKVENVRLVFVDLSQSSNIFSLVSSKALKENIDPKRFITIAGDITRLSTKQYLHCDVIANSANCWLKPGGGGVNAAIFKAAGEMLEIATRECAGTLSTGNSVIVPLPSTSPLYQREGVTHVIHVLGPNMNPGRPHYLKNDYDKGCKILHDTYSSLFKNFESIVISKIYSESGKSEQCRRPKLVSSIDLKMKRDDISEPWKKKKSKGDGHGIQNSERPGTPPEIGSSSTLDTHVQKNGMKVKKAWDSWAQALHKMAMHPGQHKAKILEEADDYIVLNDLYPKAKRHILVLSRLYGLDSLSDVRKEHVPLLNKMHSAGCQWAQKFLKEDTNLVLRLGYHSVPSMRQLHLHVISQDFDSPHLKNKKHWNSFNTCFFRDSADVIEEIDSCGMADISNENLLQMELRCHRCRSAHPNIPKLKSHVSRCNVSLPPNLLRNGRLVITSPIGPDKQIC